MDTNRLQASRWLSGAVSLATMALDRAQLQLPAIRALLQRMPGAPAPEAAPAPAAPIAEVPVELLFTEGPRHDPVEDWTAAWQEQHDRWADLALARLRPHLALYDYFLHAGAYPQEYMDWYTGIFQTRHMPPPLDAAALLSLRHRDFLRMELALQRDPNFFRRVPVRVEWSPRGYFNIRDGHHRAAFLFRRGWRQVPVTLSEADQAAWRAGASPELRAEIFGEGGQRLLYTPLLHPELLGLPSERDGYAPSRLELFLRHLGPSRLTGVRVLDIGCNTGFYAQHFCREGAQVTGVEPDPRHARLARLLNAAYGTFFDLRQERFEDAVLEPHEVGILLSVFYHFASDADSRERFLRKVDACVTRMLFWESGAEPEREKQWILEGTHFQRYQKLGETWGTGKARELGVFSA